MRLAKFRRTPTLAVGLASIAALAALVALVGPGGLKPASAAPSGCPNSNAIGNFKTANNVAASFTNSGNTTTYTFASLTNENPKGGVPGLIDYCVYPTPIDPPTATTVTATGADGAKWTVEVKKPPAFNSFSFSRPAGDNTNIPLDGKTTQMGTATWATIPTNQTILLHVNDPTVCGNSGTCFVKPGSSPASVCDKGDTTLAYNANAFGAVNCFTAALGFEAQQTNEFGDGVGLAAGTPRGLASLDVVFGSFACTSGSWTGSPSPCVTTPGATFTLPITATIYNGSTGSLGPKLASVTQTVTMPYRPSADPAKCPNAPTKWFNPDGVSSPPLPNGGKCQSAIGKTVTFTFPAGTTLPDRVVWTVAFNTSHYGYNPVPCASQGGPNCPNDALNVGTTTFVGAPYAGTDVVPPLDPGPSEGYRSFPNPGPTNPSPLILSPIPDNEGRPLGAIRTQ